MKSLVIFRKVFDKVMFKVFDTDLAEDNLLMENGFALLQEDGDLIVL